MNYRNIKIKKWENFDLYFCETEIGNESSQRWNVYENFMNYQEEKFNKLKYKEHNDRYLLQCFYNLQEKYDRGQKDYSQEEYQKLERFMKGRCLI